VADASVDADLPVVQATPCRSLRSNGMCIFTDGRNDGDDDEWDNSVYTCFQTMKGVGPDEDLVNRRDCRVPARKCYEPT
jgi:hypothetical protein